MSVVMMRHGCSMAAIAALFAVCASGQPRGANYDESKVPQYTLPDPLILENGQKVAIAEAWVNQRRPELFRKLTLCRSAGSIASHETTRVSGAGAPSICKTETR